jgi:hypothetical protein
MKQSVVKMVALVFATSLIATTATAQQSAEVKVLNRWLGSWKSEVVIKPSKWVPEEIQWVEDNEVQWVFDHHMHMLLIKNHNDDQENLALQRYNPQRNKYEMWTYAPDISGYYLGGWDAKSKTMTWEYVDFGAGITGRIVDHFIGEGKWKQSVILKDKKGDVLLNIRVERTRTKQQTK